MTPSFFTPMKVSFYFKASQSESLKAKGYGLIYYYVMIDGRKSVEKSTKIQCHRDDWDANANQFIGEKQKERNENLKSIAEVIETNKKIKEVLGETITVETIEMKFIDNRTRRTFKSVLQEYMAEQFQKIRKEHELKHKGNIELSTYETYEKRERNLNNFLVHIKRPNMLISEFDERMCERLDLFMTTVLKTGQSYANKHIKLVRTVVNFAKRSNIVKADFTENYRMKPDEKRKVTTLNQNDYQLIEMKYSSLSENEQKYIDILYFLRETLFHIGDYKQLSEKKHLQIDESGRKWIVKGRKKRTEEYKQIQMIPLSKKALQIIEKYNGIDNLPKPTDQHINRELKAICKSIGITKKVTTKIGRSSGISIKFNKDKLRSDIIKVVAGWTTTKEMENYLEVDMEELSKDYLKEEIE